MADRQLAAPSPSFDRAQARLVFWICVACLIGVSTVWSFAQVKGLNTGWDQWGVPPLLASYVVAAWVIHRRPEWVEGAALIALVGASVFCLGATYHAGMRNDRVGWASMSSTTQFMPLLYVAAFVALKRHAAWFSWAHYAGLVVLYGVSFWLPGHHYDGTSLPVHVWTSVLTSNPAYIVALHYITTLKGRLTAKELEHQQSKERFLAMLSHEIRSPLQAMLGSIDLLALKARSETERRAVERLRSSATQLDTHLRDVTEFTRLENPAWQLREEPVNLLALCREVIEDLQPQAQARRLMLHFELSPPVAPDSPSDTPAWAWRQTDARRLRQVLTNLLTNALKYTPDGEVLLRLLGPHGSAHPLTIEVEDTGIGIAPTQLDAIFEPYVRLEDERVAHEEGSGLGLAVVKLLTVRLGLTLSIDSRPERGTTFRLSWPPV